MTRHSVQDWEGGVNHPSAERLHALIAALLAAGGVTVGREQLEAEELWSAALREATPMRTPFDHVWFSTLHAESPARPVRSAVVERMASVAPAAQAATSPLLETKLYVPRSHPGLVPRPRLIERLNHGTEGKLTLVSAPAGFGKTTLLGAWVAACGRPVAWLSLDAGESDPARFLSYLVAALRTIATNVGSGLLGVLPSPQPPPTEALLTALLNEIAALPAEIVLVLDDYHLIDAAPVDQALTFLLEHLPPRMHLVIATREDPQLPLARLRARGQLTELRVADLRFTPAEAADFLTRVMGLELTAADVAALEDRTEGWIAGLQLAAISMQGHEDVAAFIAAFTGTHRFVLDYLVEEVLHRQPEPVRSFLLQTAILDRLTGSLCDAVTALEGGIARLEALERGNLFVVPLDDQRHWYRYHHLFAEVLHAHLMAEQQPDQVATLHRRASTWYEQHDSAENAIRHALAARDFARAADLIELTMAAMTRSRQLATLLGWLELLPDQLFRVRPVLSAGYASVLVSSGVLDGVEARLRDAERWLTTPADVRERPAVPATGMVVVDEEEFRLLPGSLAMYRAALALGQGDVPETVKNARRALDLAPEDDHRTRGGAAFQLGIVSWASGDLQAAHRMCADGMANVRLDGNISAAIGCAIVVADIQIAQGRLHDAMTTYERAVPPAPEHGAPAVRGTADMYVGMSELLREHNDLTIATHYLLRSQALGELAGLPKNPYRWRVAMARIRQAHGEMDGALDLLDQAERLYQADFAPNVRPLATWKTRVWIAQGRFGLIKALGWAREQGLSVEDDLSYLREFNHITLARLLLARHHADRTDRSMHGVPRLLERLLQAAQAGGRMGNVLEILLLQALAHQTQGDLATALVPLARALVLAEPEGYVRIFVDEGPPMAQLLRAAAARGSMPDYTGKLLAAFEAEQHRSAGESPLRTSSAAQPLIESLSQRELRVLRLLKEDLSGPEIAHELVVALSTVRTHTKGIYTKLNVNNRRAAVKRAAELGLL